MREALDTKRNPFYQHADVQLFLAERDGRAVGRIAAIENRAHNRFHEDSIGFFGFLELVDDQETADALVDAANLWLGERGLTALQGPMSPSTNHECGLLVGGFEHHPMIMTPRNPPYYAELLERAGLAPVKDLPSGIWSGWATAWRSRSDWSAWPNAPSPSSASRSAART